MQQAEKIGTTKKNGGEKKGQSSTKQQLSYQLASGNTPALIVNFHSTDKKLLARTGSMSWMTPDIAMRTIRSGRNILSKLFAGQPLFFNEFACPIGTGTVALSNNAGSAIAAIELGNQKVYVKAGNVFCLESSVDSSHKLFGKLNRTLVWGTDQTYVDLAGSGVAHIGGTGQIVSYELKKGEELIVDEDHLLAYEENTKPEFRRVGGGISNYLFGGEGLFTAAVRGPGKVWVQTAGKDTHTKGSSNLVLWTMALLGFVFSTALLTILTQNITL